LDPPSSQPDLKALQDRLRRLETAVEATGLGLWEWNVATGELTWNSRNRELFGVEAERPLTIADFLELVHPDDRAVMEAAYAKAAAPDGDGTITMEYRTAAEPDGKPRWLQTRGRLLRDEAGAAGLAVGANLDITDRKVAEERRSLILRELAHRAKNGIVVMMTIVAQTARNAVGVKDFEAVLQARLQAMADSQDLVTQSAGQPLPLNDLLNKALQPFDPARFDRDPRLEEVSIPMDVVVALALLLHEMATNAVKYGALSTAAGRVTLGLTELGQNQATMTWVERGGPPVTPPTRRGFGSRLLDVSLRTAGGQASGQFDRDGFRATIRLPTGRLRLL